MIVLVSEDMIKVSCLLIIECLIVLEVGLVWGQEKV